jgi:CBS domain-containing protein
MSTAREIMTPDAEWVVADTPVSELARSMANRDLGGLPVCDGKGHLMGMVTDRDIVVKVVALGRDPGTVTAGELIDRPGAVTVGADDPADEAIRTMKQHAVRRLPVIDGDRLVGMVSQADVARAMPDALVGAISEAPPNN